MNIDIPKYISKPIREELQKVSTRVARNLPKGETPGRVFVSTSLFSGELKFLSVWLFTSRLVVEIRNPLEKGRVQYEMARFKRAVDWIRLNAREYEFKDASEASELELEFTTVAGLSTVISATGEGCDFLMALYREQFLPNFIAADALSDE